VVSYDCRGVKYSSKDVLCSQELPKWRDCCSRCPKARV